MGIQIVVPVAAFEPTTPTTGANNTEPKPPAVELEKRQKADERLVAFGSDLLGDGIDPHTGSIQFSTTDVSIPGNFDLPVAITRTISQGRFYGRNVSVEFGDWQIQVPRLHALTRTGHNWTGNRCTKTFAQSFPQHQIDRYTIWYGHQYSNGLKMDIPGQGSKDVLELQHSNTNLWPAGTEMVTVDAWRLSCGSANNGQGFIGHAPDGTKYRFDRYIAVQADPMGSRVRGGPSMNRTRNIIAATQVTDVNGNTVNYDYDSRGRLTAIRASDGRRINLTYSGTSKLIRSVIANPGTSSSRTWTYAYAQRTFPEFFTQGSIASSLISVTQPDSLRWSYELVGMSADPGLGDSCPQINQDLTVTHPHGVSGTFRLRQVDHRTSLNIAALAQT